MSDLLMLIFIREYVPSSSQSKVSWIHSTQVKLCVSENTSVLYQNVRACFKTPFRKMFIVPTSYCLMENNDNNYFR